jgi:hypothetical protein
MSDTSENYKDVFRIERAMAIEAYAQLEAQYAYILADLLGTTHDRAGVIIFRITNARSRRKIVEDLVRSTYKAEHAPFWFGVSGKKKDVSRGVIAWAAMLDEERNSIVHWIETDNAWGDPASGTRRWIDLRRHNWMYDDKKSDPISLEHLTRFREKCNFARLLLFYFLQSKKEKPSLTDEELSAWGDVFHQPVLYPPSDDHPIAGRHKVL